MQYGVTQVCNPGNEIVPVQGGLTGFLLLLIKKRGRLLLSQDGTGHVDGIGSKSSIDPGICQTLGNVF